MTKPVAKAPPEREKLEPILATPSEILGVHEQMLLFGKGGTGKTHTALTAPEPIWVLTPGNHNEVKTQFSKPFVRKYGRKEIYVTSVLEDRVRGQMVDNPSGYDQCCDAVDDFLEWNDREGIGVKTIVIDNCTRLEEYIMNKAIMAEYVLAGNKEKTVLQAERQLGIRKPHDSTWGGAQSLMDPFMNWLTELPFHLVVVAHTYEVSTQLQGSRERVTTDILPLFVGAQRTTIPNKFDNLWYAKVTGGGRSRSFSIQTQRSEIVECKTRIDGILNGDLHKDPDITSIIKQFSQYAKELEKE